MLVFSLVAHEYAHGFAALKQGDDTALLQGRLTLNPLPHIDLWFTILMPAMLWFFSDGRWVFGGARPVQVRPDRYRNYRRGDIIVSGAGVFTNALIALACAGLFMGLGLLGRAVPAGGEVIGTAQRMLTWGVWLNLMLGVFNLLPIPPLDGSHILYHFLPRGLRERYRAIQRFGFIPLLALMMLFPKALQVLLIPAYAAMGLFFRVAAPFAVGPHSLIFQA